MSLRSDNCKVLMMVHAVECNMRVYGLRASKQSCG